MSNAKNSNLINMKSILAAAGEAQCYDADKVVDAFDLAAKKGYTTGVISADWMDKVHSWRKFNEKAIVSLIERSANYPGDIVDVPADIKAVFYPTTKATRKTRKVVSKKDKNEAAAKAAIAAGGKEMNLRTLLHKCYEYQIDDANLALDILSKMGTTGYVVLDKDIEFAQGWKKFAQPAFKKMVENTYNGANNFSHKPLLECDDFEKYLPLNKLNGAGKALNVRTVLDKFYDKGCVDAIKILATLQDLEAAGYQGVEYYNVPGLANKSPEEVGKLLAEAHAGTGCFKGMDIVDCPNF